MKVNKLYNIFNCGSTSCILITSEHAGKIFPPYLGTMGLKKEQLSVVSHLYDIGVTEISKILAKGLKCRCILSKYSRLVADLNRSPRNPNIFLKNSFGIDIPGNFDLTEQEKNKRMNEFYWPYHYRVKDEMDNLLNLHEKVFFISIHSFNQFVNGRERKGDIGLLYRFDKDLAVCSNIKELLKKKSNLKVVFNQPYSAKEVAGYTLRHYGKRKNITCFEFEINDKHLKTKKDIRKIGSLLLEVVKEAIGQS